MKTLLCLTVAALSLAAADGAFADGEVSCAAAPRAERKPTSELVQLLKSKGWVVRKLQMFNGCYEVYGFDEKGRPVEAFFDPKTLARVAVQP